jgi:hypothetical protein
MSLTRRSRRARATALLAGLVTPLAATLAAVVAPAPAGAAVGDDVIAWVEVENGVIAGGPAYNSGDHGNFSGEGSYTFRETGMTSTMTVDAAVAGTYPVWIRYAAGPLSAAENVTRSMGLVTNGSRQQVSYPMTSTADWETWRFARADVTLNAGANTIAVACDRGVDFCRLNFDAIQVGGTVADPCTPTPVAPGFTTLFDGTFATFDGWRKSGGGGLGRQTDCTMRTIRGSGSTWLTQPQEAPYTLRLDWRRGDADDDSAVHLASSGQVGTPTTGFSLPIGANTGAIVTNGGAPTTKAPDAAAVAGALRPVGQWNTYTVQLTPTRLTLALNGTVVNTLDRSPAGSGAGFIGLSHPGNADRVDFRDVQLQPDLVLGRQAAAFTRARLADGTTATAGGESTLATLVADAQKHATQLATNPAQLSLVHPDALAADLAGTPGGYPATLTYKQAAAALPSSDTLVTLRLTGTQLKSVLEQQWQPDNTARPFVRLGASRGLTTTFAPTAGQGERITGIWIDGAPVAPNQQYYVTVSSSLAVGVGGFPAFNQAANRRTTNRTAFAALSDYLADPAAGGAGPVVPHAVQQAVGVTRPGGAPTTYAVGDPVSVDLTSWSFSHPGAVRDTSVTTTVAGVPAGSFPVDNTVGTDAASDGTGKIAVRTVVPPGTPAGAQVLEILGATTGTLVRVPLTVEASTSTTTLSLAPTTVVVGGTTEATVEVTSSGGTPTGAVTLWSGSTQVGEADLVDGEATATLGPFTAVGPVTVEARYAGDGGTSGSTSAPATVDVVQATSATTVSVAPSSVVVTGGTARVTVAVSSPDGATPTGVVELWSGTTRLASTTLVDGTATATVGPFPTVGARPIEARYLGSAITAASTSPAATLTVVKAASRTTAAVRPAKVVATKTRATVTVAVTAPGHVPSGVVAVKVGSRTYTASLRSGRATITLAKFAKAGTVRASVTYRGDARTTPSTTTRAIKVVKAPRKKKR